MPIPQDEAERRLSPVRAQEEGVSRYQSILRLRGKSREGRVRATLVVAFERPDRLRVELLAGPFETTQWTAVASNGEIAVFFPGRRQYVREPRVSDVVRTLLGAELGVAEVMSVLSGTGVPMRGVGVESASLEGEVLQLRLANGSVVRLAEVNVLEARTDAYRVRYPDWNSASRAAPGRIEIATSEIEATLLVEDLDVNVPLSSDVFTLAIPADARRVELERVGDESIVSKVKP